MIYLRAIGGLGNQMFQIAFARYLSIKYNKKIFIDISLYENYKIRNFSLDNLYISEFYIKRKKLPFSSRKLIFIRSTQILYRIFNKFLRILGYNEHVERLLYGLFVKKGYYYNLNAPYFHSPKESKDEKFVFGYFQSEKYFKEIEQIIRTDLKVKTKPTSKEESLLKVIKSNHSIGVSMRLGEDYSKIPTLNVCDADYYLRGIKYLVKKYPQSRIFIFSDDIAEAKKIIGNRFSVTYIEGFKDYQSLRLLYSCENFVIGNSTFSWWGAYLSDNRDKEIVAPSKWMNTRKYYTDIYTESMTKFDV